MKIDKFIQNLINNLAPRQKEFLVGRFGLAGEEKKTLQELGDRYGITRERVRQIEAEGLKSVAADFAKSEGVKLIEKAVNYIQLNGGVKKEADLANELKVLWDDGALTVNQIRFLFEVVKNPLCQPEDEKFHAFWYLDKDTFKKADAFAEKAAKFFANKKEDLISKNKFSELLAQLVKASGINDVVAINYLAVSKKFGINAFNDFGLSHWEEIYPKTAKDKAYLILKKHGKPLHFTEIADKINKANFSKRLAYAQTIHNELIKSPKFVLVGRGMYALKEHGYEPGTAKEIIQKILKDKGPMNAKQLLEKVFEQRFLKENTILLNLQNRKHFKKLSDGKYHIA